MCGKGSVRGDPPASADVHTGRDAGSRRRSTAAAHTGVHSRVALIAGGLFAYKKLNIEAYPDPVPPLVDIVTQNPGQSSEEIERYITIPIEVQMAGMPYVTSVRTISLTGLCDVKVQFTYDISYVKPRSW